MPEVDDAATNLGQNARLAALGLSKNGDDLTDSQLLDLLEKLVVREGEFSIPAPNTEYPSPEQLDVETGKLLVKPLVRGDKPPARGDTTNLEKQTLAPRKVDTREVMVKVPQAGGSVIYQAGGHIVNRVKEIAEPSVQKQQPSPPSEHKNVQAMVSPFKTPQAGGSVNKSVRSQELTWMSRKPVLRRWWFKFNRAQV